MNDCQPYLPTSSKQTKGKSCNIITGYKLQQNDFLAEHHRVASGNDDMWVSAWTFGYFCTQVPVGYLNGSWVDVFWVLVVRLQNTLHGAPSPPNV